MQPVHSHSPVMQSDRMAECLKWYIQLSSRGVLEEVRQTDHEPVQLVETASALLQTAHVNPKP